MSSEVSIPEEAFEAAAMPLAQYMARSDTYDAASDAVRAAAPLIVAAELERLKQMAITSNPREMVMEIARRASVLRGEGGQR